MSDTKNIYPPCFVDSLTLLRLVGYVESTPESERTHLAEDIAAAKMSLKLYESNWKMINRPEDCADEL